MAVVVCSVLVLVATGTGWVALRQLTNGLTASAALGAGLPGGSKTADGAVNVLLIGLDTRLDQNGQPLPPAILDQLHAGDGSQGGYNTNTLIVLHIPADGGKVTAFSIPRDDLVDIPGYRPGKIKQAYGVTKDAAEQRLHAEGVTDQATLEHRGREAGRQATVGVVQNLTGLPIDHFAEITLAGFYDLATALGGVAVCLNHPVSDDYSGADFPTGPQTLTGAQALAFVRQRHGLINGDLDRTHRQQAFLSSAMHQLISAGTLTDPARLGQLIDAAHRDIVLDQGWDILTFATQAQNLTGGNATYYTLPIEGFTQANGEDDNLVNPDRVQRFIADTITAAAHPAPPPAPPGPNPATGVIVDVANGGGIAGAAAAAETALAAAGFTPGVTANTAASSTTGVHYPRGAQAAATAAARRLGPDVTVLPGDTVTAGHLQVVLGAGYTPPQPPLAPATPAATPPPGPPGLPVTADGVPCID